MILVACFRSLQFNVLIHDLGDGLECTHTIFAWNYPTRGSGWYAGGQDYSSERPGQAGNGLVETSRSSAKTNAKSCLRNGITMCNCAGWGHLVEKGLAVPVNSKLHSKPLHQIKTNTLGWISKSITSRSREVISSSIQQLLDSIPGAACPVLFSLVKERHSHTRTSPVKDHQTRGLEPRVNQLTWEYKATPYQENTSSGLIGRYLDTYTQAYTAILNAPEHLTHPLRAGIGPTGDLFAPEALRLNPNAIQVISICSWLLYCLTATNTVSLPGSSITRYSVKAEAGTFPRPLFVWDTPLPTSPSSFDSIGMLVQ